MKIKLAFRFLGGMADGDNLTGSCILARIRRGKKEITFLVDAGLLQCDFRKSIEKNKKILDHLDMSKIDFIIITHSHVDHVGRLPLLTKNGFKGRIICTEATVDLMRVMLEDSARIQASEAKYLFLRECKEKAKKGPCSEKKLAHLLNSNGKKIQPLYSIDDVQKSFTCIKNGGFDYHQAIKLDTGISLKFYPSGHVLGGAICIIEIKRPKTSKHFYLGFSGDLGRKDGIILPAPEKVETPVNFWITESTYGGKKHPERDLEIEKLFALVRDAVANKKKIIIPSFALERTQEIVYILTKAMDSGAIPKIPILLDSPMALLITKVFAANWHTRMFKGQECLNFNPFDPETNPFLKVNIGQLESVELSKSLETHIVIAGSGMGDAGRIRNHLRENLGKENTIVCLVGYMAKGSLGRKLQDALPLVKMNKTDIDVKASIVSFSSFSAHADSPFLVSYAKSVMSKSTNSPRKIFIVHGEEESGICLKNELRKSLPGDNWMKDIVIPALNETYSFSL
jgi:metallo-beta-lactamase family protein